MSGANEMASIIRTVGSDIYLPASLRAIIACDDREITTGLRVCSLASPIARWFSCPRPMVFKRDAVSFVIHENWIKGQTRWIEGKLSEMEFPLYLLIFLMSISCFRPRLHLLASTLWRTDLYLDILFAWHKIKTCDTSRRYEGKVYSQRDKKSHNITH